MGPALAAKADADHMEAVEAAKARPVALHAASAVSATIGVCVPATAPVMLPLSVGFGLAAAADDYMTTGRANYGDLAVLAISAVPGAGQAGAALTGVKEVGDVIRTGQEVLHAGAATLATGAAAAEATLPQGSQQNARPQGPQSPPPAAKHDPSALDVPIGPM